MSLVLKKLHWIHVQESSSRQYSALRSPAKDERFCTFRQTGSKPEERAPFSDVEAVFWKVQELSLLAGGARLAQNYFSIMKATSQPCDGVSRQISNDFR
jgi:hypothetical protein